MQQHSQNWYSDKYRRHLADMHIEDWDELFLSKFDPNAYVDNLLAAQVQVAMIYMQSHTGLCNFPTKVSKQHRAFSKVNKVALLTEKCKEAGIQVVGYYSLIYNNQAYYAHPDWRMVNERGKTAIEEGQRYGLVCPNNVDYRNFLVSQIDEFAASFTKLDGVFYDMPFWPLLCTCESCRKRFMSETGRVLPLKKDWSNPVWLLLMKKRQEWMAEFVSFVSKKTKEELPGISVSQNFAGVIAFPWWAGSTESISDACDYVGGDLYGDILDHSFSCKYYLSVTRNSPFEYMLGSCEHNLQEHTVMKTESKLTTEIALTAAHHGATMIIDAIDPDGTLHAERYRRIGKVFGFEKAYEPYLRGSYVADIAVYYDSKSQFCSYGGDITNKICANRLIRTFIANHVAAAVIANNRMTDLSQYKMIFAPCLESVENEDVMRLIEYVRDGGKLYLSSVSDKRLLKEFFDGKITGFTKENKVYMRPTDLCGDYLQEFDDEIPMSVGYAVPLIELNGDADILAKLTLPYTLPSDNEHFVSIHSDPPGIKTETPVMLRASYGKGTVIWCAAPIESETRAQYRSSILNMMYDLAGKDNLFLKADCSESVEIVAFAHGNDYLISFIDLAAEERKEFRNYSVEIKTETPPQSVSLLPDETPIDFMYNGERVCISGSFSKFQMIRVRQSSKSKEAENCNKKAGVMK